LEDQLGAGGLDVEADYTGHLFPSPSGCSRGCREEVLVLPGVEQAVVPAAEMPGPMWPRQLRDAQMVTVFAVSRYRSGGENVLLQERFREQIAHPFLPVDVRLKVDGPLARHASPHHHLLARADRQRVEVGAHG